MPSPTPHERVRRGGRPARLTGYHRRLFRRERRQGRLNGLPQVLGGRVCADGTRRCPLPEQHLVAGPVNCSRQHPKLILTEHFTLVQDGDDDVGLICRLRESLLLEQRICDEPDIRPDEGVALRLRGRPRVALEFCEASRGIVGVVIRRRAPCDDQNGQESEDRRESPCRFFLRQAHTVPPLQRVISSPSNCVSHDHDSCRPACKIIPPMWRARDLPSAHLDLRRTGELLGEPIRRPHCVVGQRRGRAGEDPPPRCSGGWRAYDRPEPAQTAQAPDIPRGSLRVAPVRGCKVTVRSALDVSGTCRDAARYYAVPGRLIGLAL